MKIKIIVGLFAVFMGCLNLCAQQAFTVTTTAEKTKSGYIYQNKARIDHLDLDGNSQAIIIVTPQPDNFGNQYPSPVGVQFLDDGKWYIANLDLNKMQPNKPFHVRFWTRPDANHFVHKVSSNNLKNGMSRIDSPALDKYPGASFTVFPASRHNTFDTVDNNASGATYNNVDKKWYIVSTNGKEIYQKNAFNIIVLSAGTPDMIQPDLKLSNTGPSTQIPSPMNSSTSPTGAAGGDLNGNYPNPNVIGLQGRPISNLQPKVGDTLKWDGTQWQPTPQELTAITQTTTNPNPVTTPNPNLTGNMVEPLTFKPNLGKKIILYPGQTGDVGFSVQGNLLQIHSDKPEADVAIGYNQGGTFNEKLRVKGNGALAVSGDTGQPGQVLTSNGVGSAPTWKQSQAPGGIAIQTHFKNIPQPQEGQWVESPTQVNLTSLGYSLTLEKKSRVKITAKIKIEKDTCGLCNDPIGGFYIKIDNVEKQETKVQLDTNTGSSIFKTKTFYIADYMIDLEPGTRKIEFWVNHISGTTKFKVVPHYSSLMIIPLE